MVASPASAAWPTTCPHALTPKAVEAAFYAGKNRPAGSLKVLPVTADDNAAIERDGLNAFRVRGRDRAKGALVFRRHGLGWKLAGVDLPRSSGG